MSDTNTPCTIELGNVPTLTGCPGANEFVFVINAIGGLGNYGYGKRLWSDIYKCIFNKIKYIDVTFVVGQVSTNPLFSAGQSSFVINIGAGSIFDTTVGNDNLFVSVSQSVNPANEDGYIGANYVSFTPTYNQTTGDLTITMNEAASDGELYLIKGIYLSV